MISPFANSDMPSSKERTEAIELMDQFKPELIRVCAIARHEKAPLSFLKEYTTMIEAYDNLRQIIFHTMLFKPDSKRKLVSSILLKNGFPKWVLLDWNSEGKPVWSEISGNTITDKYTIGNVSPEQEKNVITADQIQQQFPEYTVWDMELKQFSARSDDDYWVLK